MKKKVILALIVVIMGTAVYSQPTAVPTTGANTEAYVVKEGENLWRISQKLRSNPYLWEQFVIDNPFLQEAGRVRVEGPGKIFVRIYPGETLNQTALKSAPVVVDKEVVPVAKAIVAPITTTSWWGWADGIMPLLWLILILAVATGIYLLIRNWQKRKEANKVHENAITAGPPMIREGLSDQTVEAVMQQRYPNVIIERIERGQLYSDEAIASYGDNQDRRARLNGEIGYQVTAVHPNNQREILHTLRACANDVRMGGGLRGAIRFVPEAQVVGGEERPLTSVTAPAIVATDYNQIATIAIETAEKSGRKMTFEIDNGKMTFTIEEKKILLPTNGATAVSHKPVVEASQQS